MMTVAMKIKDAFSLQESYDKPRQPIKKQKHHFANKGPYSQTYGLSKESQTKNDTQLLCQQRSL